MISDSPLPDRVTLRALIKKARAAQPFTGSDYLHIVNVLVALEQDSMYALKERMARYEAEAKERANE